jgi:hypothetical protein
VRRAAKVDTNQSGVVKALRKVGAIVQPLHMVGVGCPDLLVGYRRQTFLLEVKDGERRPSEQKLTPDQEGWHREWRGLPVAIVRSEEEALAAIGVKP